MKSNETKAIIAGQIEGLFVGAGLKGGCYSANSIGRYLKLLAPSQEEGDEDQDDQTEGTVDEENSKLNGSFLLKCLKFNRLMKIMMADSPGGVMEALLGAKDVSDIDLFNFCVMMAIVRLHQILTAAQKAAIEDVALTSSLIKAKGHRPYPLWKSPHLTMKLAIKSDDSLLFDSRSEGKQFTVAEPYIGHDDKKWRPTG